MALENVIRLLPGAVSITSIALILCKMHSPFEKFVAPLAASKDVRAKDLNTVLGPLLNLLARELLFPFKPVFTNR